MGQVKQRMIEMDAINLNSVPDKHLCVKHINDNTIKRFIRENYTNGYCDYCEKEVKVVSLEDLLEFMMLGISNFYEDAANFMSYNGREGGYLGETFTPDELIQERIGLETDPFELTEDIVNSIEDIAWSEPSMYYDTERDELMYRWSYFKNLIKHKSRYLFQQNQSSNKSQNAFTILKEVGKITKSLNLIKKIEKGTIIYRCRQHHSKKTVSKKEKLVSPPEKYAIYPNRFSPSGISMLYSAFDPKTAFLETISREDKKKDSITISKFKLKKEIYVVDFNRLPKLPSIFDYKKVKTHYLIRFLYDLVRDFTQEIKKDGKEHIEYVPTQVVTEYFRYPFNKNRQNIIEGIVYPSSKNKSESSSVIFWNNKECLEYLELVNIEVEKIKNKL
ncbi:HEPN-associated N-terminal domain-containing protein [Tenacibaculum larymnensis]|uniref:RES domain-containing protein n=1 Tax=Tenacibaculum larymnensis TaxID=2878201 RepID=A0A9X4EXH2_9FLAO|nr:HEPN-associated N-terminal domain-containing protein [Tenacibaculum larymnensis]MDE1208171.1 RES domain-containing protein [Tenacibaculum larymnensis]